MRPSESFVQQPVRDLQTMLRVLAEADNRQPTVIPDGIYGPSTMQAVSAFQRRNDLPQTGITDMQTWDRIVLEYEDALIQIEKAEPIEILMHQLQVYRKGDINPYLYLVQSMLTQLSKDHLSIPEPEHNGILDDKTSASVSAFQLLADLPVTGEVDKKTWKHLVHQFTLNVHQFLSDGYKESQ